MTDYALRLLSLFRQYRHGFKQIFNFCFVNKNVVSMPTNTFKALAFRDGTKLWQMFAHCWWGQRCSQGEFYVDYKQGDPGRHGFPTDFNGSFTLNEWKLIFSLMFPTVNHECTIEMCANSFVSDRLRVKGSWEKFSIMSIIQQNTSSQFLGGLILNHLIA